MWEGRNRRGLLGSKRTNLVPFTGTYTLASRDAAAYQEHSRACARLNTHQWRKMHLCTAAPSPGPNGTSLLLSLPCTNSTQHTPHIPTCPHTIHITNVSCTFHEHIATRFQRCACISRACARHKHISAKEVVPLQGSASKHAAACQEAVHAINTFLRRKLYLCKAALPSMLLHVKRRCTP